MSRETENQEKYATKIENIHRHAMDPSHQRIRQRTIYRYEGKVWKVEHLPPDRAALKAMQEKEKRERLEDEAAMKREIEAVRREIGSHAQYE